MPPPTAPSDPVGQMIKLAPLVASMTAAAFTAYMTTSVQMARIEERLRAEVDMRTAADARHDAERVQDRAELREQFKTLGDKLDEVLRGRSR